MHKTAIIISGGNLEEETVLSVRKCHPGALLIGVDRGLVFMERHGLSADHLVGDFDSVPKDVLERMRLRGGTVHAHVPEKDATDTQLALELALDLGCTKIRILGGIGSRMDHVLANIHCLSIAFEAGATADITDCQNRIQLIRSPYLLPQENAFGPFFSLFPLGDRVEGLCVRGAKYPLENHTLTAGVSLGVSNAFAGDVEISFTSGRLLLIEALETGTETIE